jgi:SAM-dependent methyltransferase
VATVEKSRHASVEFEVCWGSAAAQHRERVLVEKVNFWRDLIPGDLGERLARCAPGETVGAEFAPGQLVSTPDSGQVLRIPGERLRRVGAGAVIEPRPGRFYPRGLVEGLPGTFPQDRRPFRCLARRSDTFDADFNHPLAGRTLGVAARLVAELPASEEHGGRCNDLIEELTALGPGLQADYPGVDTDFFWGRPFAREDQRQDAQFYREPRFVQHLDATAIGQVRELYGRLLRPGMRVLDLMSSWTSHLPDDLGGLQVTGVGMNAQELEGNPRLAARVVQDLNRSPRLPFEAGAFDAAVCTVSVEYLTRPVEVFAEVARVLSPGGAFVLTFSDRWFPPKVIRLWTELHPFERMGLVLRYFRDAGGFVRLQTETVRGWPRPREDKYADRLAHADPVYAVWGWREEAGAARAA